MLGGVHRPDARYAVADHCEEARCSDLAGLEVCVQNSMRGGHVGIMPQAVGSSIVHT